MSDTNPRRFTLDESVAALREIQLPAEDPSPVTRYELSRQHVLDLGEGFTTSRLMIEAARSLGRKGHTSFTFSELEESARALIAAHGLTFPGETTNTEKYRDDAARIVNGRFGDLHRSGVFTEVG